MLFLIILLSVAMVFDCIILCILVLMQLPKKEAGAALAFGGAATDALFGAGSGNLLTKATKYSAAIFFALAIALSLLESARAHRPGSDFMKKVQEQQAAPPPSVAQPPANQPASSGSQSMGAPGTNRLLLPAESNASNSVPILMAPSNAAPATQPK
jgi:preprotein translocase subunit SecG